MVLHIVGLDLSLTATGVARLRPGTETPPYVGVVTSSAVSDAKYPQTLARLRKLTRDVRARALEGMEEGDVLVIAVEGPSLGSTNGHVHTRAGFWWLVMHILEREALGAVVVIEPAKLKRYVTGKGNSPKDAVLATMARLYPHVGIIDNNEADALALAAMVSRELGFPQEPSPQRVTPSALEGVDWSPITQRRTA